MQIAWVLDRQQETGGIARATHDTVSGLPDGFPLVFITPEQSTFPELESLGVSELKRLLPQRKMRALTWAAANIVRFGALCRELRPDTVVCDHTGGLYLSCAAKKLGVIPRIVYRNHGAQFLHRLPYSMLGALFKSVDVCLALNDEDASILRFAGASHVSVLPNPLPLHCAKRTASPDTCASNMSRPPVVGHIGHASARKGIESFKEVATRVYQVRRDVRFRIVGENSREAAESLAGMLGAARNQTIVEWFDALPRDSLFSKLDVLCVCSPRESFSLTTVEAPFFNCLPIVFESPGPLWLQNAGNELEIVSRGNTGVMAERVLQALQNRANRLSACAALRLTFSRTLCRHRTLQKFADYLVGRSC